MIRDRLKTAQSRYKSYADNRRRDLEFQVGDMVFLRVAPKVGIKRFGKKGKLGPRFIGPFAIIERIGSLAYRLALPPSLERLHDVFHVSMLRKYVYDSSHVLPSIPEDVEPDMSYIEQPIQVIDTKVQES